jgi:ubiquinone biosynthesis UbiH/UbiF/VisC/COQ6 family hydroxylase
MMQINDNESVGSDFSTLPVSRSWRRRARVFTTQETPMTADKTEFDVIIIGAGPAGLALATSLAQGGLNIALVERQSADTLADPGFDGREIAITHRSAEIMRSLGAWDRIAPAEISTLAAAHVLNGASAHALCFEPTGTTKGALGLLLPNHVIRRALFEVVREEPLIRLFAGTAAAAIATDEAGASARLADGTKLTARLLVAADTRFSDMRRRMGIPARMRDFGKTMMVFRMAHELPHHSIATEWFGHGQTIAILPLDGDAATPNLCSVVLTLKPAETEKLMAMDEDAFNAEITSRYQNRLGAMRLVGTRHAYPLVATYASRFVAERFALVGDAAVGMHPVTAHGFNFGLIGVDLLSTLIAAATARGGDIGGASLLARYQTQLRRATLPLYLATNSTALLYTDDRLPARALRDAAIRAGERLAPLRHVVVKRLMAMSGP